MPRYQLFQKELPGINLQFHVISGTLGADIDDYDLALRHSQFVKKSKWNWFFAPEVIIPVCSRSYLETRGRLEKPKANQTHTRISLAPTTVNWTSFSSKANFPVTKNTQELVFSDYALVLQAAMLGRGVALGWLSGIALSLRSGELVPASGHIITTGGDYHLMSNRGKIRDEVRRVQIWFCEQMQNDMQEIRQAFPQLQKFISSEKPASRLQLPDSA